MQRNISQRNLKNSPIVVDPKINKYLGATLIEDLSPEVSLSKLSANKRQALKELEKYGKNYLGDEPLEYLLKKTGLEHEARSTSSTRNMEPTARFFYRLDGIFHHTDYKTNLDVRKRLGIDESSVDNLELVKKDVLKTVERVFGYTNDGVSNFRIMVGNTIMTVAK